MLLAGIGAVWAFRTVVAAARFVLRVPGRTLIAASIAGALAVVVIWPVLVDRDHYANYDTQFIKGQIVADQNTGIYVNALIDVAKQRGGGRVYAGMPNNWGSFTKVDQVDVLYMPLQQDADSLGFTLRTDSLSQDIESYFDDTNPAQYDLFDVKYVLDPPGRTPSVPATVIAQDGGYSLWQVQNVSGYLEVVDTTQPVAANRTNMAATFAQTNALYPTNGGYLASQQVPELRHPLVAFDGAKPPPPSSSSFAPYVGAPGRVESSSDSLANGRFAGRVSATRASWVMLKESYAPHWRATVDGKPVKTAMLAPSFVGVPIPAGTHDVVFQYHSDTKYPEYVAIGVVTLLGLAFGPTLWRRNRRRHHERVSAPPPS